jgi:hypothetical protein
VDVITGAIRAKRARRFFYDRQLGGHGSSSVFLRPAASPASVPQGSQTSPSGALPGTSVLRIVRMYATT